MIRIENFNIDSITITESFKEKQPKPEKVIEKLSIYFDTGVIPGNIVIDENNNLVDGYISYLIARAKGFETVTVYKGAVAVLTGRHKAKGRLYMWYVPEHLQDEVEQARKVVVNTNKGLKTVKVENIIYLQSKPRDLDLRSVVGVDKQC